MKNKIRQFTAIVLVFLALGLSVARAQDDNRSGQTGCSGGFMGSGCFAAGGGSTAGGGLIGSGTAFDDGGFMGSGGRSAASTENIFGFLQNWVEDIF